MLEAFQSKNIVDSLWNGQILIQVKAKEKQKSTSPPKVCGYENYWRRSCICLGPTKTWKISSFFISQKPVNFFDSPQRCIDLMESIISPHFNEIFHNRSSPFCLGPVDVLMIHVWKSPHVFVERVCDDCWFHWVCDFTLISPLKFLPITFSRAVLHRRNLCWWVRGTRVKVAGFLREEF